ncbi:hypothetical protein KPH14_007566 [Odynerus spinipes]|uniref:Uncharacterized protein n=1 Tax=Odynerus spinipes TaxID=1348599 RepID=A0AAD9RHN8_9HYME|nr:hypothetical protein KPH14_007566 [Odynerus spinipes]
MISRATVFPAIIPRVDSHSPCNSTGPCGQSAPCNGVPGGRPTASAAQHLVEDITYGSNRVLSRTIRGDKFSALHLNGIGGT